MTASARNALAGETSPYLLQHADNPVQWYPWGEAAIARARALDRPILLSIGYAACHWCHVMAHESFEDPETAALMNEYYINVKVDREERPDLDKIYQIAHQILARRPGGWPLTVFLTADDLTPFFAGTYFPPESRHGLPGFKDLLRHIAELWRTRRSDIKAQNAELRALLARLEAPPASGAATLDDAPLAAARREAADSFDARYGGFGRAPKFPHPGGLDRLLRDHAAAQRRGGAGDHQALHMALVTLERMACGGVHDQLGGGFYRYSVDERWLIPHFEKMLYDNGPLLALYAEAWQVSGRALFRRVAEDTAGWMLAQMRSPEGGFYSSLDADAEGEEGRYYVWDRAEIEALLEPEERAVTIPHFGLDGPANFEGRWHLRVARPLEEIAAERGIALERAERLLAAARGKLLAARACRTRPARDEKILTSWNALAIRGLAVAGRILARPQWLEAATRALDFVRARLWREGRLLAAYKDGRAHLDAYLDDYAFLIEAVLALLEARWRDGELDFAVELAEVLRARFEDRTDGGFFFTADDHERVLARLKPFVDDALPAGNGVAAWALQRLGHLLDEPRYLEAAERTLRAAWASIARAPGAHHALLRALEEYLEPTETVVLRGSGAELERWRLRARGTYAPQRQVLAVPAGAQARRGLLAAGAPKAPVTAYLCRGSRCEAPLDDYRKLDIALRDTEVRPSDPNQERPR